MISFLHSMPFLSPNDTKVKSLSKNPSKEDFLNEILQYGCEWTLTSISKKGLFFRSDELLSYVLSLLKGEQPHPPQTTVDEWSELVVHLRPHWLIPLLYWKIGHLPLEVRPPESIAAQMREVFLVSHARYLTMERQISDILDAFNREKISALVVKGPALAWTLYPTSATRPSADIDLLVRTEQYVKAREVLNRIGYRCLYKRFETFKEFFNSEPFSHRVETTRPYEVDLHWSIFQYHGLKRANGMHAFFDRGITVETPALTFQTLSTVDALIQAAFHLILHHPNSMRLIWISDIALLAQQLNVPKDWEVLQERTLEFKASLAMEKALKLAQLWYGLRIPQEYQDFADSPSVDENEKTELAYVTNKQTTDIRLSGYLATFRKSPNKTRFLVKFLFPRPYYIRATYPSSRNWLLPLSYARRWGHWFAKLIQYGLHAWRLGSR